MILYAAAAGAAFGVASAWWVGSRLSAPAPRPVILPPDFDFERVSVASASGASLSGWASPAGPGAAVVLLHGIRSTRMGMLSRAGMLLEAGYGVALFDFQAHGESSGTRMTFGYLESRDAQAAVAFARARYGGRLGAIGASLGGAAALLAQPPLDVDALVLESVYPTIMDAVQDRIEMVAGSWARWMAPLLTCQLQPRIGCGAAKLCPIERAAELRVPKLFIAGTLDRHTKIDETRELFRRAAEPKELWEVDGARHEDLHAHSTAEYRHKILEFFAKYLK